MKKYEEFELDLTNEEVNDETSACAALRWNNGITMKTCPPPRTQTNNCGPKRTFKGCSKTVNTCRTLQNTVCTNYVEKIIE